MVNMGICNCGKWGVAPDNFKENKHFLKCECGQLMYLSRFKSIDSPIQELAFSIKNKISTITLTNQ